MAGESENKAVPSDHSDEVGRFLLGMSEQEKMLVVLKRDLYEGQWDEMVADLKARLAGGPYIFKLATRIEDDLARIERLRDFESHAKVDLSDYVASA